MSGSSGKTLLAQIPAREWRGLVPYWEGGRLQVPLRCGVCNNTDHWSATRVLSPERAIPKIIQLGWRVDGTLLCPACIALHGRRKVTDKTDITSRLKLVEKAMANPTNVTKLEPTPKLLDDLKKNKRLAILALEDYYNEAENRYRDGKNDKAVADELGLSPGFVANVREEFYGKLAEPEELAEVREKIGGLRKSLDALEAQITGMCARNGWKV